MIGYLWAALICLSILTAAIRGDMAVITPAIFTAAERGVKVAQVDWNDDFLAGNHEINRIVRNYKIA